MKRFLKLWSVLLLCIYATPVMASSYVTNPKFTLLDDNGDFASGACVYFYEPGSTTKKAIYTNQALTVPASNPITLDSRGEASIFGVGGTYKIVANNAASPCPATPDNVIWSADNVGDIGGATVNSIDTIADLRGYSFSGAWPGSVSVKGYYAAGDGGGGPVRIWAEASTCTDNGGQCIKPTAIDAGDPGRWVWADNGKSNIDWWGAKAGDSTDDLAFINAAIGYYESISGGEISFSEGEYQVSSTITSAGTGIFLHGLGGGNATGTISSATVLTPVTTLKYTGAAGSPLVNFTYTANDWPQANGGIDGIFLHCGDGAGVASVGLKVTSRRKLVATNLSIFNATEAQVMTSCEWGSVQHCLFENITGSVDNANTTGKGLKLTGAQGGEWNGSIQTTNLGNTAFNTFINTRWGSGGTQPAVQLQNTDNNTFVALRANGGDTEEPITVGALELGCAEDDESGEGGVARYNNFFGVEAVGGVFAKASQTGGASSHSNNIYGYNISNGGIRPLIQTGAGGSDSAILNLYGGAYNYLPNENILPAGATIDFAQTSNGYTDSRDVSYSKFQFAEQGNFDPVPTIVGTTAAGVGTYSVAAGFYEINNGTCHFTMRLVWSAHTGTGNMRIAGLPFASIISANLTPVMVAASNLTFPGQIIGLIDNNAKTLTLYTFATGGAITALPMDTAGTLYISGSYRALPQ